MLVSWLLLAFLALSAFSGVFCITAPAQVLELAFFITAPAHPHATSVAVYPALLNSERFFLHYAPAQPSATGLLCIRPCVKPQTFYETVCLPFYMPVCPSALVSLSVLLIRCCFMHSQRVTIAENIQKQNRHSKTKSSVQSYERT